MILSLATHQRQDSAKMKRVLIITYYWPPTGGSGVQRWLKFAKYLPQFGWQPVVYTPENPDNQLIDESLDSDIPIDLEVLKQPILDPSRLVSIGGRKKQKNDGYSKIEGKGLLMRLAKWVRGNMFIPDSRIVWVKPSVTYLIKYLKEYPVDVVITTGPPHSMHLIGEKLSSRLPIKWFVDLRDPISQLITNQELGMSTWALKRYKKIERRILEKCDIVLSTSPGMPDVVEPFDRKKFHTITNGYDDEDFKIISNPQVKPFVLTHAGLLSKYRVPKTLLAVLDELISQNISPWDNMELHIAGIVSDDFYTALDQYPRLKVMTKDLGYLDHADILDVYQTSSILLLLMNQEASFASGTIPGKIFEYFAARKPILSLGPSNALHATYFERDDFSAHLDYQDEAGIKQFLIETANQISTYDVEKNLYSEFERKKLSKKLSDLLSQIVNNH